jgi:hypothetical protein
MNSFMVDFKATPGAFDHSHAKVNARNQLLTSKKIRVMIVDDDNTVNKPLFAYPTLRGLIPGDAVSYCGTARSGKHSTSTLTCDMRTGHHRDTVWGPDPKYVLTYLGIVKILYDKPDKATGKVFQRDAYEFVYSDRTGTVKTWVLKRDILHTVFLLHSPW